MKLFIDTGSVAEVEEIAAWGVLSGATTNPSLLAKEDGATRATSSAASASSWTGPTSAEVVSDEADGMIAEGRALARLHPHVVVKVPFSRGGPDRHARAQLRGHPGEHDARLLGHPGAPDRGGGRHLRLVLHGPRGRHLGRLGGGAGARSSRRSGREREAQVLAASLRNPMHAVTAARLGCEVATVPGKVLKQMLVHPLTEAGIERFGEDWQSRPEFGEWLQGLVAGGDPVAR